MNKRNLVIIPTYNEKDNIALMIDAVFSLEVPFDILVVDDNSPDGTGGIVQSLIDNNTPSDRKLFLKSREGKLGLGTAYIEGFKFSLENDYDYIFEMDADFSHDPKDLVRLWKCCHEDGNDVAVGSRYISGVNVVNWPLTRVIMSYGASVYVRIITGMRVKDATAGFVCYKREVLDSIDLDRIKFIGYAFQIEMKYLAVKFGYKLKEVPIVFTDRIRGDSKMSISIFKEAFFGVISLKFASMFGRLPRKFNQSESKQSV